MKKSQFVVGVLTAALLAFGLDRAFEPHSAIAHTQTPSMTVWTNGQTLTATDLNNTFSHIHNTFSGNITDSMINASAAIQHSKLAVPSLVPKLFGQVSGTCAVATCTLTGGGTGITSITRSGVGVYAVNFAARTDNVFTPFVIPTIGGSQVCATDAPSTYTASSVPVKCFTTSTGAAVDAGFSFFLFDNNT